MLDSLKLHYYPARVESKKPIGSVTLKYLLKALKDPNDRIKRIFKLIAKAELYGNMKRKATLKQNNLYYFTPCVNLDGNGRGYKNIVSFTGLAVLDFDHIEDAEEFKIYFFNKYKWTIGAFLSPSKKGVKFLVKIPLVNSVDEFKSYYYGLGLVLDKYKGWDGTGQNCVLPLFISWDPNTLHREDAEIFNTKGKKIDYSSSVKTDIKNIVVKDGDQQRIYDNITKALSEIIDNGHPQLRAACISLGGYVAAGYLTLFEAESFVHSIIPNHNYLRKGISGYRKTASEAIRKGSEKPLIL